MSFCRVIFLLLTTLSCGDQSGEAEWEVTTRSVSTSGYPVVSFSKIPTGHDRTLTNPVQIGADGGVTFSSISDLEVSSTHGIVVLDSRASELRRFHPSGTETSPLAGPGEGPGEIGRAIGIAAQRDGTIWVSDFGNSRYSWFPPNAVPGSVHAPSLRIYGLVDGGVTDGGKPWVRENRAAGGPSTFQGGIIEGTIDTYLVGVGLGGNEGEVSISLGTSSLLTADLPQGRGSQKVQYTNERLVAFDPKGAVWTAESDRFQLVRLNLAGDTMLVIDVEAPALQIPGDVRRRELRTLEEWFGSVDADVPSLEEAIPRSYPLIERLAVDPQGRIWVQRREQQGTAFLCFTGDGKFAGRYLTGVTPWAWGKPAIGENVLVVVVADSFDVQSLVAWHLPR